MRNLIYLFFIISILSCSAKKSDTITEEQSEVNTNENYIVLTQEQIELAQIKTSKIEKKTISETIKCTGKIEVPPQHIASVSSIIEGFIKTINYYPGNSVKKGDVLATLQHPDFISLQKDYFEARSKAEYYQEEFKRQGELTVENAASIKNMQKAKSDYLASEAKYKSLKSQLDLLGVNVAEIEHGDFLTEFNLLSPIHGKVSHLNANRGKYVNPEEVIFEIINESELFLNLNIFEKDIRNVKTGQNIKFHLLNDKEEYNSKVSRIGIKVENKDRTTLVQSTLSNTNKELKPGMHVIASVLINEKETMTIPSDAVVESNNKYYLFAMEKNQFRLIEIEKGIEQNEFTEIKNIDKSLLQANIVTQGSYYLISQFEAGE